MISYAGVYLGAPYPHQVATVEAVVDPDQVLDYELRHWPGRFLPNSFPTGTHTRPAFRLNTLFWPVGAARWSLGRFLVDEARVEQLRQAMYPGGNSYTAEAFVMDDGTGRSPIRTLLYMLPPRPIFQVPGGNWLWLLTMVDDRFFWWERSGTVDGTTWQGVYEQIAALLQINLSVDAIASAYGVLGKSPTDDPFPPLPRILDDVARAVGQRIVRAYDGTVTAQNVTTAKTVAQANLARTYPVHAGGQFQLQLT